MPSREKNYSKNNLSRSVNYHHLPIHIYIDTLSKHGTHYSVTMNIEMVRQEAYEASAISTESCLENHHTWSVVNKRSYFTTYTWDDQQ